MDEHDKRRVGEQIEPGGRPKAPGRLELLQRFVNTHNHDFPDDWDRLGTAAKTQRWLREKGLPAADDQVSEADAARLRALREALRALLVTGRGQPMSVPLRVTLGEDGRTTLVPAGRGVEAAIASLLAILHEAQLSGEWSRMKACRECEYAFYDRSKNRSAA